MPPVLVRPHAGTREQRQIDEGRSRLDGGISAAWYADGGIEASGGTLTVINASGQRLPAPVPPGGRLLLADAYLVDKNVRTPVWSLLVVDRDDHVACRLPVTGIVYDVDLLDADKEPGIIDGLPELAREAGLGFEKVSYVSGGNRDVYEETDQTVTFPHVAQRPEDARPGFFQRHFTKH